MPAVASVLPKVTVSSPSEVGWNPGGVAADTMLASAAAINNVECMM